MLQLLEGVAFLAALNLYLVPAIVADARERDDAFAITLVNVLLGWTVIGWFAALVWARHPVSERRLLHIARRSRRAIARVTIEKIVARGKWRSFATAAGSDRRRWTSFRPERPELTAVTPLRTSTCR
jgi:Superinfection immunity protein